MLIVAWLGGLAIWLSLSRLIFGHWLWEVSTTAFVLNVVITLIILTLLWWRTPIRRGTK